MTKGQNVSGKHFTQKDHAHLDLQVQIIEKVTPNIDHYRLEREEYWIKKFATKLPFGLITLD